MRCRKKDVNGRSVALDRIDTRRKGLSVEIHTLWFASIPVIVICRSRCLCWIGGCSSGRDRGQRRLDAVVPDWIGQCVELLRRRQVGELGQELLEDGSDLQNVKARISVLVGNTSDAEPRALGAIDQLHLRSETSRFGGKRRRGAQVK